MLNMYKNKNRVFRALLNWEASAASFMKATISHPGERNNKKWARLCHYRLVKYFVGGSATGIRAAVAADARGSLVPLLSQAIPQAAL
jgi:hypothetical protein